VKECNKIKLKGDKAMRDYDQEVYRPMKELPRRMVWGLMKKRAKRALMFPGKYCDDVIVGLNYMETRSNEVGRIDKETEFVFIERNPKVARDIKKTCKKLGLENFRIIVQDFSGDILKDLGHFDIMFFDFCGGMSERIFNALMVSGWSAENIAFTFDSGLRNNDFHKKYPGRRASFVLPAGATGLLSHNKENSIWTCDAALAALRLNSDYLVNFFGYKEKAKGCPMIFFTLKTGQGNPATKAHRTRRINLLQTKYDAAVSAGVKAGIRRKMNQLLAV